jgi:hypothetical protein
MTPSGTRYSSSTSVRFEAATILDCSCGGTGS